MDDVWDKDLLHVTYHPGKITLERMQSTIRKEEFTPEIRNEKPASSEGAGTQADGDQGDGTQKDRTEGDEHGK